MEQVYDFGLGRRFVLLSDRSGKWVDIDGAKVSYATVESVTYEPSLAGQYAAQRVARC